MDKSKDDEQTFVIKILDDLRSNNRAKSSMHYDTSIGLSPNNSLSSNKRRRSCSPDLQEAMLSNFKYLNYKNSIIKCLFSL